jgi:hypothetical protein
LSDRKAHSRTTPAAAAIPRSLRASWWALLVCDAVIAVDVIAAARLFARPAIYLSLIGPFYFGATLALIAWWHTRGPGRRLWSSPASAAPTAGAERVRRPKSHVRGPGRTAPLRRPPATL